MRGRSCAKMSPGAIDVKVALLALGRSSIGAFSGTIWMLSEKPVATLPTAVTLSSACAPGAEINDPANINATEMRRPDRTSILV